MKAKLLMPPKAATVVAKQVPLGEYFVFTADLVVGADECPIYIRKDAMSFAPVESPHSPMNIVSFGDQAVRLVHIAEATFVFAD